LFFFNKVRFFVNYFGLKIPATMVKLKKLHLFLIFFFLVFIVNGQVTMTKENGVVLYCATGSVVWINGSLHIIGDSLYNNGTITIAGQQPSIITNEGDLINDGKISGNGKDSIGGHWINNGIFRCGTSEVIMNNTPNSTSTLAVNQLIEGTQITAFYDLTLVGVGIKSITLNDTVRHFLNLNDRELAVDNNILSVSNIDPLAIKRTSGFVSNLPGTPDGWLSRKVGVAGSYLFPMGSSGPPHNGPMRYRPVEITTHYPDTNRYIVGFYDYSATLDGYNVDNKDTTICLVDSLFYHKINRLYNPDSLVDITIYYDHITDGPWDGMANFHYPSAPPPLSDKWVSMTPTSQLYSPMWGITKSNWNTWTYDPYALVENVPDSVTINGSGVVCIGSGPVSYSAWGDSTDVYIWTINGGHFVPGTDTVGYKVQVIWTQPGIGVLTVIDVNQFGNCRSLTSHFFVIVNPQPIADFQIQCSDSLHIFSYDLIHFVDLSKNASQWSWNFGDGEESTEESPYHVYPQPGKYNVCLTISSPKNCVADTCIPVDVVEGIFIPNVFTPNGDGKNDVFDIQASGMSVFQLEIYNRWGALLFESESPSVKWDGRTMSGEEASDGTYFYILTAKSESKDYSQHGCVTLLRH
jgi:gliding motility-associated-like protein